MEEKNKKYEGKNSVIEFVEGWDMIQTLGEGAFGEYDGIDKNDKHFSTDTFCFLG